MLFWPRRFGDPSGVVKIAYTGTRTVAFGIRLSSGQRMVACRRFEPYMLHHPRTTESVFAFSDAP